MTYEWQNPSRIASECPLCGKALVRKGRRDKSGEFLACTGYPRCCFTENIDLNVARIGRELRVALDDRDYLKEWTDKLAEKLASVECTTCRKHFDELQTMLGRIGTRGA